jgi:hypothetical protein
MSTRPLGAQATVIDWEGGGDTYTVELYGSGQLKYMVESSDLRARREGAFDHGALVDVCRGGTRYPGGRVLSYDDESDTYEVQRHDSGGSGKLWFVSNDELREVRYW